MRYAIIENEYFALENLRGLMGRCAPESELVFSAESVRESVAYFMTDPEVDLVFMDIELVDGNCFEILEQTELRIPVIFTTAYDHYALEAFRLDTVDYILKPVSEDKLRRAVDRYSRRQIRVPDRGMASQLKDMVVKPVSWPLRVLVADGDGYSFVDMNDVSYFYAEDKYVFLVDSEGREHLTMYTSLVKVEEDMDPASFFRVSRKVVAGIRGVGRVSRYIGGRLKIELRAGKSRQQEIVSPSRRIAFLQWLGSS